MFLLTFIVSRELGVVYLTVSLNEFKNKSSCDSLKYAHVKFAKPALLKQILFDPILISDLFSSKIIPVLVRLIIYTAYHSIFPYSVRMRDYTDQLLRIRTLFAQLYTA